MLIIVSGVSGVGKNTIINELIKQHDNMRFFKSVTTRGARPGECNYIYLTEEEFAKKEKAGHFFETVALHSHHVGTLNETIDAIVEDKDHIYIKDIDVYGNRKMREYFKGKSPVVSIFLDAPDEVIYDRLIGRGETEENARFRMSRAPMERACLDEYDLVIENLEMPKTVEIINNYLKKLTKK